MRFGPPRLPERVGSVNIVAFIEARLDEDERVAQAATQGRWEWSYLGLNVHSDWTTCDYYCEFPPGGEHISRGTPKTPGHEHRFIATSIISAGGYDEPWVQVDETDAAHIAHHNPARVLRQCAALRQTIEALATIPDLEASLEAEFGSPRKADEIAAAGPDLGHIAAIWSDHPDFRPEWAA